VIGLRLRLLLPVRSLRYGQIKVHWYRGRHRRQRETTANPRSTLQQPQLHSNHVAYASSLTVPESATVR